jgi:hypothetical protein
MHRSFRSDVTKLSQDGVVRTGRRVRNGVQPSDFYSVVAMSALGQKQTCAVQKGMSALPPKADIPGGYPHVCFVPRADIGRP